MRISIKSIHVCGLVPAAILAVAACSPPHVPAITINDLMEDRVVLDGVLIKCNRNPSKINSDMDCLNARIAIERLAKVNELGEQKKHAEEFERIREQLRVSQDLKRQRREAAQKVDPYNLPVIPVDGAEGPPALIGQTKL